MSLYNGICHMIYQKLIKSCQFYCYIVSLSHCQMVVLCYLYLLVFRDIVLGVSILCRGLINIMICVINLF